MNATRITPPCASDPDLWFSTNALKIARAIAICQTCPILDQCAQIAADTQETWGVWAGELHDTTREDRAVARERRVNEWSAA